MNVLVLTAALMSGAALAAPQPRIGTEPPYPEMQPPVHALAENGQARACIVVADEGGEVERFAAANLADHDSVRAHAERGSQELADRDPTVPPGVRGLCLEVDDVRQPELELLGIFDDDHALIFRRKRRQCIE